MRQAAREALQKLRAALAAGDYGLAQSLLGELRAEAEALAAAGALDGALLREWLHELECGRRLVLSARAHDAARLGRLGRLPPEYAESATARCAICLDA